MQVRRFTADWRAALALGLGRLVEEAEIPAEDPAEIPSGNPVEVTAEMQTGSERPPEAEGTAGGEGESQGAHVANGKGDEREAEESAEATAKDTAPGSQAQKDANSSAPAAATPSTPTAKVEQAAGADGLAVADNGTRAPEPPISDVISVAVLDLGEILLKYTRPSLPPVYLPSTSHPPLPVRLPPRPRHDGSRWDRQVPPATRARLHALLGGELCRGQARRAGACRVDCHLPRRAAQAEPLEVESSLHSAARAARHAVEGGLSARSRRCGHRQVRRSHPQPIHSLIINNGMRMLWVPWHACPFAQHATACAHTTGMCARGYAPR